MSTLVDSPLSDAELAAVAGVLRGAGTPVSGPLSARLIAGGRSNLTYRLADEVSGAAWVMRTPPRAGRTPSAHDVAREWRIVSALDGAPGRPVPVPSAVAVCEDESLIGLPFAVCGFVEGVTVQSRADLEALDASVREAAVAALVATLAALHAVEPASVGLGDLGRPDGYAARQLRRWGGQWDLVGAGAPDAVRADAARLVAALGEALPRQAASGLVHGDYRIDNTLLRLGTVEAPATQVAAVVDWELSTLGDPVADVAMMAVYRLPAFDLVMGEPTAWTSDLLPDVDALAEAYEAAGGARLVDWDAHLALACLKIAVIAAGIEHRHRAAGGHPDDVTARAGQAVGPYLAEGLARLT
ncbi:phosphotransferase family protein [Nocardioides sp. TRM66260-LWL]|uniref:phosphotransferase family protein n=1 Tax=Nocardioides sp. TRM66260-LWL TaxID=2874478 RepID=UPI001CC5CCE4|nr:phosphotransferase family protein [Nocardioides sp. TRM66260-LWL]MBZ5734760.1 phosphotransferase family protein [Nocardioides sp. TRM66260-LWL]